MMSFHLYVKKHSIKRRSLAKCMHTFFAPKEGQLFNRRDDDSNLANTLRCNGKMGTFSTLCVVA